jgi:tape measure domain-containing protein
MADLQKAAAATPFELTDLTKASQVLLGFGFNVKQTKGLLEDLGNAASATGGGAAAFGSLATIFGQIQAKGRLQGDEVLQLAEMGVPALRILQKELGLTAKQLTDRMGKGAIDANTAIGALRHGFQEMYGGAMQTQSQTFSGQISTLRDNMSQLLGQAARPLFEYLRTTAIPALNGLVQGFRNGTGFGGAFLRTVRDGTAWVREHQAALLGLAGGVAAAVVAYKAFGIIVGHGSWAVRTGIIALSGMARRHTGA